MRTTLGRAEFFPFLTVTHRCAVPPMVNIDVNSVNKVFDTLTLPILAFFAFWVGPGRNKFGRTKCWRADALVDQTLKRFGIAESWRARQILTPYQPDSMR